MAKFDVVKIGLSKPDLHEQIQVALANIPVRDGHIEDSYLGNPDLSRKRLKPVANLLNDVSRWRSASGGKIDLLVFPEVSIPYAWESMLVAWARKHRIGVVCGLEHRVSGGIAYNEVLAALPYKAGNHHWACMPVTLESLQIAP